MYQTRELPVPLLGHFYFLFALPCKKTLMCALASQTHPRPATCIQILEVLLKIL